MSPRRRFFETYPGLAAWHERERQWMKHGETETRTLSGRRCVGVERFTEWVNAPVQGTGANGLKLALALLWERRAPPYAGARYIVVRGLGPES